MLGYSEGAAVVHIWVSENWPTFDNVNAALISDPKRQGGPGADGLAGQFYAAATGPPLDGSDRNFGDIPTVSICTNDVICDSAAPSGWIGYLTGAHGNYSFDVDDYSDDGNGQWFNGVYMPRYRRSVASVGVTRRGPVGAWPPAAARRSNETSEPTSQPSKAST